MWRTGQDKERRALPLDRMRCPASTERASAWATEESLGGCGALWPAAPATAGCRRTRRSQTVTQAGDRSSAGHAEDWMIGCDVAQFLV
jgi:hypothetical protein